MKNLSVTVKMRSLGLLLGTLLLLVLFGGCQAKEAPLSPAAVAFKKEIQDCLDRLCQGVIGALVKKDVPAINEALKQIEPQTLKLCRMCPFRIGILDQHGDTVTVYPFKVEAMGNFSSYEAVAQTLKSRPSIWTNDKVVPPPCPLTRGVQPSVVLVGDTTRPGHTAIRFQPSLFDQRAARHAVDCRTAARHHRINHSLVRGGIGRWVAAGHHGGAASQ